MRLNPLVRNLALALPLLAENILAQRCDATHAESVIQQTIPPLLKQHDIPGMAVGVTLSGAHHFAAFGVSSRSTGARVTPDTIFEIGSISKTFTATLAAYAQATGKLSLSDPVTRHLPELAGSAFDKVNVLELITYTPGGLPLQFPAQVTNQQEMLDYFRNWRPDHPPGTHRLYSNPSIGLAGHIAAKSLGQPFRQLVENNLFPMLGLRASHIQVPPDRMPHYAYGYNAENKPIRVNPGVLDAETYGVKTTARDLLHFLDSVMHPAHIRHAALREAISTTRTGYYRVGPMTQGLGWEMYPWPATRDRLLEGNSTGIIFQPNPAQAIQPPQAPKNDVLLNKTGSTNGFGAYVAFVPSRNIAVVLLANRNYPIPARVTAAHQILTALDACASK